MGIFAVLAWAAWKAYCNGKHDQAGKVPGFILAWAWAMLDSFHSAKESCDTPHFLNNVLSERIWKAPLSNQLRLDVDASFDGAQNLCGVSAVVRDSLGKIIGATTCVIRNSGTVLSAELEAVRFGMYFCVDHGFSNANIFSDSLKEVQAINTPEDDLGPDGVVVLEIKSLFNSPDFMSISHMRRTANGVAHMLARKALFTSTPLTWLHSGFPTWLLNIVSRDC
ncbi:uncharacterized protein [Henckelia pumila]|uniref:uncharacterized protein n=1 Tax=Henckelia pumila TaxID=405737 RepID=UPI003C6E2641